MLALRYVIFAIVIVATSAVTSLFNLDIEKLWPIYKKTFDKMFFVNEEATRKETFAANLDYIAKHNLLADLGIQNYRMRVNSFCDSTVEEVTIALNGYRGPMGIPRTAEEVERGDSELLEEPVPLKLDWREHGLVTKVKSQGECGSCWAFSTTGSLEGQVAKKTGKLISLSEQNLVDCSYEIGNAGCMGGWMGFGFQYIHENKGIMKESEYPYQGNDNKCRYNESNSAASLQGFVQLPPGDEMIMKHAVANIGPIAIAIDASQKSFQFYGEGVYDQLGCSSSKLDHAVLLVGYGSDNGQNYWLVKNSWGESWGLGGYIKMSRGKKNQCGVATAGIYPVI